MDNDSQHVRLEPFSRATELPDFKFGNKLDVPKLKNFLKCASELLSEMLSQDLQDEKISHMSGMEKNAVIVAEDRFQHQFLFSLCRVENAVSVSDGLVADIFVLCHSIAESSARFLGSSLCGFVSGWRPNNLSDPFFLLSTYEEPTCATVLRVEKDVVAVIGYRDGSLSCQDLQSSNRPVQVLKNSSLLNEADGLKDLDSRNAAFHADSFYSCALLDENHMESVVDVTVLSQQDSATGMLTLMLFS